MIAEHPAEILRDVDVVTSAQPTIWGLAPIQLHDHFWAARGVFVVRPGEHREIPIDAELYLLTDVSTLAIFRLAPLIDTLSWVKPSVMFLRIVSRREQGYQEGVVTGENGEFVRYQRLYGGVLPRLARAALTRDRLIAAAWQQHGDSSQAWKRLRRESRNRRREVTTIVGRVYDRESDHEVAHFSSDLVRLWSKPSATIGGLHRISNQVWAADECVQKTNARFIGPAWVGAGRSLQEQDTVLGPAILWDEPSVRTKVNEVKWSELEPAQVLTSVRQRRKRGRSRGPVGKRLFDIVFALIVLLLVLPIFPFVMLAIWIEDGRPFFFAHRRETLDGREFGCIKFRSMRRDAEQVKAELIKANQADGPQFYMASDPRLTRVGNFIRKTNIDELPQFINVLLGDMSIVGPRPSPIAENQFNPAWREARLSVRAGITGLWQVSRTRQAGMDFQEWIKYDLAYVQNASWRLDLSILFNTVRVVLRG